MDRGTTISVTSSTHHHPMVISDDDDDEDDDMPSSPESGPFEDDDMIHHINEDITSQLASAGPTGVAAAAAITSTKKRKRSHTFETNPSIRKRQQTRLLRKLRQNIDEFSLRVGQQAVVLVATPGKQQNNFRVFGAKPLEDVVKNLRAVIMTELETALARHAPPQTLDDPTLHELPPLVIDGIPTPVEKMTQAQLRAFIPLMLKYSTGRGKPGWGKDTTKPIWWPKGVPWANVRMDARREDDKQKVSWTHALRQIVTNCYKYHGRDDLLPSFSEDEEETGEKKVVPVSTTSPSSSIPTTATTTSVVGQYTPTVVQTISNSDGTVSIIQVDPSTQVITLPDGSTAHVQGVIESGQLGVHTLATTASASTPPTSSSSSSVSSSTTTINHSNGGESHAIELSTSGEISSQEGHILITGEDGQAYPVSVSGMITVPVPASMYQAVVANMQNGEGHILGTPVQITTGAGIQGIMTKVEPGSASLTITPVATNNAGNHFIAVTGQTSSSNNTTSSVTRPSTSSSRPDTTIT